uniref:ZP domain-containing protein n=1 Tax=Romanomermis culicivorax TaxID=13658 RepID=A0A915ISJ3_ROMCU
IEPRGLTVNFTVIISFHEQFLTTADQAYSICCFYMETEKVINAELEVSMLTTAVQTKNVPMPECRYEVLGGSPGGDIILQARVGDPVYHKWSCHTSSSKTLLVEYH